MFCEISDLWPPNSKSVHPRRRVLTECDASKRQRQNQFKLFSFGMSHLLKSYAAQHAVLSRVRVQVVVCAKLKTFLQGVPEISQSREWDRQRTQDHNASGHGCRWRSHNQRLPPVSSYLTGRGSYPSFAAHPPPANLRWSLWVSQQTPPWRPGRGYGHHCGWYIYRTHNTRKAKHNQLPIE